MGTIRKIIKKDGKASWEIDYYDPLGKRIRVRFQKKKDADDEISKRMALMAENRYLDVKKENPYPISKMLLMRRSKGRESRISVFTTCATPSQAI